MKTLDRAYYIIIPLLIVGISMGYTTFPVALLALLPLLFSVNRNTLGLFFLMFAGPLGGIVRSIYPFIPVYGLILQFLGLFLLREQVQELCVKQKGKFLSILLVLLFFGFFYLIGPRSGYAYQKYMDMCSHGILMLFGYYALDRSRIIEVEKLTRILMIASICMFTYVISIIHMSPGGLWDYNWFREQFSFFAREYADNHNLIIDYQHIGMQILFSIVIYLSQIELNKAKLFFYGVCALELVLMSGCRQAILGFILAIVLRLILFRYDNIKKGNNVKKIVWISCSLIIAYFVIGFISTNLGSDATAKTIESGDLGRELLWLAAIDVFESSPLFGAGIGGFFAITGDGYPHNFVLELLAETGIVGLLFSVMLFAVLLRKKGDGVFHLTASSLFYYLILLGLFVRIMVSSDLSESIGLYSAVIAITASRKKKDNTIEDKFITSAQKV